MGEMREVQLAAVFGLTWLRGDFSANNQTPFQKDFPGERLRVSC